ncbi:MAG: hypothetical protein Ta2D_08890 [Rickettsiales bacterium]|nr:MAG: hypothetical protein Ta2D_08890 [Rickettsiales bacterium]
MQKLVHYIKKIFNKIVFYIFLVLILLIIGVVLKMCEKNDVPLQNNEVENKLIMDIKNTTEEKIFPEIEIEVDKISEKTEKYIKGNYAYKVYNYNVNKNVSFGISVPKDWDVIIGSEQQEDPFNFTNERTVTLIEIKNENLKIIGSVSVLNTDLELNPSNINAFMTKILLKDLIPIKMKTNIFINGEESDILLLNKDNYKVTRIKTFKNSSLYYTMYITFESFYEYMKYAKDVSIIFNSFTAKNPLKTISPIKFDLLKSEEFEMLYPKDWQIKWKQVEEQKYVNFFIHSSDEKRIFEIRTYKNTRKTSKELVDEYLATLNVSGITFEGIDDKRTIHSKDNDGYAFNLKNVKDKNGTPIEVLVKVITRGDKQILGAVFIGFLESESYLLYRENDRLLDIFINSIILQFFDNVKIENTNWIKFINGGNQ